MRKKAVDWNNLDNQMYKTFWDQNVRQFWVDEEIPVSDDKHDWQSGLMSDEQKDVYEKVFAGLTLLDTQQGGLGMPSITLAVDNLHAKAIFSFMSMMEQMHAKSYSTIFSTLSNSARIEELFQWVENHDLLQKKLQIIEKNYIDIQNDVDLYKALCASVLLETYLFYSGFYYPLWWAGQGKMIKSAEIISLIIRDESIHGVFTGLIAQQTLEKIDHFKHEELKQFVLDMLVELQELEELYTKELYEKLGLHDDVIKYVKYNADKALMNLGFEPFFNIQEKDVNVIVMNGISTETKNHDFFSTKGNGYIKNTTQSEIDDSIFDF